MHQRFYISVLAHILWTIQTEAVTTDCWTSAQGKKICSTDPTGLRATWWFFFVLLLIAGIASGCFDAEWWPQEEVSPAQLESGLQHEENGICVSIVKPLLDETTEVQPLKPVYRYLDP